MNFDHRSVMLLLIKLFFVRFGNFLLLAMMDFRTAYIIRKPFASILFFDIIVEILTSSFEELTLKGKPIKCHSKTNKCHICWNNMSTFRLVEKISHEFGTSDDSLGLPGGHFMKRSLK